jgi:large subunit ribosomal protein L34e
MVRPALRSRSLKRVKKKAPSGRGITHYEKKAPSKPKCGSCGKVLPGVTRGRKNLVKKAAKSKRRPSRPYGGNLCSSCTREKIKVLNIKYK